jgi:hypothetical protein
MDMSRRRRLRIGILTALAAAIAAMLIVLHPIDVTYRLWKYRRERDVKVYLPELCDKGPSVLPHIYEAFEKHGARDDVAGFRLAVSATLRCIRVDTVGVQVLTERAYADAPVDQQLVDVIVRAFNQEPDPELRHDMLVFMWELDFRARFAIYAGLARGPHPIPSPYDSVPSVDPYDRARQGFFALAPIRAEWCRVVAPVVRDRLDQRRGDQRWAQDAVRELATADCGPDYVKSLHALVKSALGGSAEEVWRRGVLWGVARAVGASPERADALLVPLFASSQPCQLQREVYADLTSSLAPATARHVASRIGDCVREYTCEPFPERAGEACLAHLVQSLTH